MSNSTRRGGNTSDGPVDLQGGDQSNGGSPAGLRPPPLAICFAFLGLIWLLLLTGSFLLDRFDLDQAFRDSWLVTGGVVVGLAALGALAWGIRRMLLWVLTSLPFGAAQLVLLMVLTAVGTLIIQKAPVESYAERYGEAAAGVMLALGLDDLFHTFWFSGLLALMAVSLVATAIKKRAWRPPMWGHLMSHLGIVTVLLGGWIGSTYGYKGFIDLHEGQVVDQVTLLGSDGQPAGTRPLGFGLKLEQFAVEHYEPEAKFYVYERSGMEFRGVRAFELDEAHKPRPIGASGATFKLVEAYPDFTLEPQVHQVPPGDGRPMLQIDFKQDEWTARAVLQAGIEGKDVTLLSAVGPPLRFFWEEPDEAALTRLADGTPEQHLIALLSPDGEEPEEVAATVGSTHVLPESDYEVQILEFLPDFNYDTQTKRATSRSQQPNNPAVRVLIKDRKTLVEKQRWLYANMPEFGHGAEDPGPRFVYHYQPAQKPAPRELLVIGASREIWRLAEGRVAERLPLEEWPSVCSGLSVAGMQVHPSAEVEGVPGTRSDEWNNPVADILVDENGATREVRLAAGHDMPLAMADGNTFLAFEMRREEPKTFQSHLTVIDQGKPVTEKTIVVNDPLSYQGIMFYQSNFRRADPTYSGISVVYDPGLMVAFVGMVMISLGVIFVYYIRPRLLRQDLHGH